eukprot:TRINITY_DN15290_c0_g1_i1.p1 TRINITY_DN15290_c0_g1~~TRINITY_DN15290_c0_g1_i1.p1  ORF type:complete len:81 (+),score=3.37 TRINITY_DN15290_c0_g1_i1:365-607(+)
MRQYQHMYLLALLLSTKICVNYLSKTDAAVKFANRALEVVESRGHWVEKPNSTPSSPQSLSHDDIQMNNGIDHSDHAPEN